MVMDYATDYMAHYDLFSQSPNRQDHAEYIRNIDQLRDKEKIRELFD